MEIPIFRSYGDLGTNVQVKRTLENQTMSTQRKQLKYAPVATSQQNKLKRKKLSKIQYGTNPRIFKGSLKKYMVPELKRITINENYALNINTASAGDIQFDSFPTPVTGTTNSARVGKQIQLYGLSLKGFCQQGRNDNAKLVRYAKIRMQIIKDSSPNGASIPLSAVIYDLAPSGLKLTNSLINVDQRDRFKVVKEWTFEMDGIESIGYNFDFFHKLKVTQSFINDGTGNQAYTDYSRNGLFVAISASGVDGTSTADTRDLAVNYSLTLHYIDV